MAAFSIELLAQIESLLLWSALRRQDAGLQIRCSTGWFTSATKPLTQLWLLDTPLAERIVSPTKKLKLAYIDEIPEVLQVTIPGTASLAEFTMSMISRVDNRDNSLLKFLFSVENLNHIRYLVMSPPETFETRRWISRKGRKMDCYSEQFPDVRLYDLGNGSWQLRCKLITGVKKTRVVPYTEDEVLWKSHADHLAGQLQDLIYAERSEEGGNAGGEHTDNEP